MKPVLGAALSDATRTRREKCVQFSPLYTTALALAVLAAAATAQSPAQSTDKPAESKPAPETYQTFHLAYLTQPNEANDAITDLRNMLPRARVYYVGPERAISVRATPDDMATAEKVLSEIDKPRSVYRLTYTISESDGGKRVGSQHYSLIVAPGERSYFKQGSKIPIVTGANSDNSKESSQVQYEDIGLHIEASIEGARLRTKVEQSSVAAERSGVIGGQDPIIQQTVLDSMSTLAQGKPVVLGSLDIPGSTRHQDVEVVAEPVE